MGRYLIFYILLHRIFGLSIVNLFLSIEEYFFLLGDGFCYLILANEPLFESEFMDLLVLILSSISFIVNLAVFIFF